MDNALRQRMKTFPTQAQVAGLITSDGTDTSTLVKADISLFHTAPASVGVLSPDPDSEASDYEMGVRDGEAKAAAMYQDTISVMESVLGTIQGELSNIARQIEEGHLAALSSCLRRVFPALASRGSDLEIQSILSELLAGSLQGKIDIMAHSENVSDVKQLCEAHLKNIVITEDNALSKKAVKIKWQGGGAVIDCETAIQGCLAVLDKTQSSFNNTNLSENIQKRGQPDE